MSDERGSQQTRNKHLSLSDRQEIQACLCSAATFKAIAHRIGKDPTTVSKEVKKHIIVTAAAPLRANAGKEPVPCLRLLKAPFVCNGCMKKRSCRLEKHEYSASAAYAEYRDRLVECRSGIALNKQSFYDGDRIISDCIRKGQHMYHIMQSQNTGFSLASAYRYINKGYLSICKMDLPRAVKFKPRRQRKEQYVPKTLKINRTYECFCNFIAANGITTWVEMDTVVGRIGGKVLLTFSFTFCNFMLGFLLPDKTAASVANACVSLKQSLQLSGLSFAALFPVVLTDNGGEFADVFAIENNADGTQESHLFFCDPYCSSQKPHVEKGHTMLRDILPKGSSFDSLSQEDVTLVFSHINCVCRKELNGKSPFDVFAFTFGIKVTNALKILLVAPEHVIQSPKLLK